MVKKNEIYVYDFGHNHGSVQCGVRPVLVIQGNEYNKCSSTVIVAPMTTVNKKKYLPSHIYLNDNFGLRKPSMVLLEQMRTVSQNDLGTYIGIINDEYIRNQISAGIRYVLGMCNHKAENSMVYTLCPVCLSNMRMNPEWIIERVDPFQSEKEVCVKCNVRYGFDYIVSERNKYS